MAVLFGLYVLERDVALSSGSIIDVFQRLDVSDGAVRSILTRRVRHGRFMRHRRGRKAYFGLTPEGTALMLRGRRRLFAARTLGPEWDGTWTVVGFSLPDNRRHDRHRLRQHLSWEGFASLQSGLWVAPGSRDVTHMVVTLDLADHVNVMTATPAAPTTSARLLDRAFDLDAVAGRYEEFLHRWERGGPAADDLTRQILLHADWLGVVRHTPILPTALLGPQWPAIRAERLFRDLAAAHEHSGRLVADRVLDTVDLAAPTLVAH